MLVVRVTLSIVVLVWLSVAGTASADLNPRETLGKLLYFDTNLSTPAGQACASCHHPTAGFADPDTDLPVSQGVLPKNRFGNRNSPSAAYAAFSPVFYYDEDEELYVGGQFWDGRAADLVEQAKGPFLNPLEMNNPSKLVVIEKVKAADYADMFEIVYGPGALDDVESAYDMVADAIAAFEMTSELNQFSSKYDHYLQTGTGLTEQELSGLQLFEDEAKGNCAACHPSQPGPAGEPPLFTDFTYDNLGVPKNPNNPFYGLPRRFNPDGEDFVDYGLGGILGDPDEMGKVKVMTLRNIDVTPPYMHNGVFEKLEEVVDFYNTRDVGSWPPPEVPENVNTDELGDLGLTAQEVADIVAFLKTLTDGYAPAAMQISPFAADHMPGAGSALFQNSPNPFHPSTRITFTLGSAGYVSVGIFDVAGRLVRTLVDRSLPPGRHDITWDGRDDSGERVSAGVYFVKMKTGSFEDTKKAVLAR